MRRKTALAIAIGILVSNAPTSYADLPEPARVHSANWTPGAQYTGPIETSDQMSAWPHWDTGEGLARLHPSKQNLELAAWCKNAEDQLLKVCQKQDGWAPTLRNSDCVFLVSSDGKVQDPFCFSWRF